MPRQAEITLSTNTTPNSEAVGVVRYVLRGRILKRNLLIALIVGTLLTVANQFDVILRGPIHAGLLVKIGLNFAIPFVVSSVSANANRCGP